MGAQARGTANSLGKRNVTFDRPAPAEHDLSGIEQVALVDLEGDEATADILQSRLASLLSDGKRFELNAATSQEDVQAQGVEALAIIGGKVVRADYEERTDSEEATCNGDPCTLSTRTGTATVAIDFSMIDAASGKVLLRKTLEETAEEKTSAQGSPPSIRRQRDEGRAGCDRCRIIPRAHQSPQRQRDRVLRDRRQGQVAQGWCEPGDERRPRRRRLGVRARAGGGEVQERQEGGRQGSVRPGPRTHHRPPTHSPAIALGPFSP
ncbi:MAG: hypothetical protein ACE37F_18940 [Nannocystaceae bacterium]|nr:hypothetical protein [bacterium]